MLNKQKIGLFVVFLILFSLGWVSTTSSAAPRLMMFKAPFFETPIIISDFADSMMIYQSMVLNKAEVSYNAQNLETRPVLEMYLFWGPEWEDYVNSGQPLDEIEFKQTNESGWGSLDEQGWFYPSVEDEEHLVIIQTINYGRKAFRLTAKGLDKLMEYGVPVTFQEYDELTTKIQSKSKIQKVWLWVGITVLVFAVWKMNTLKKSKG